MPAPATHEYSLDAIIAAHTALLGEIDAGTGAGKIKLYTEADALLVTIPLSDPAGTVNGTTGQLTITAPAAVAATAGGICTWGTITDSDDNVVLSAPAQKGASAVSGKIVITETSIVLNADVTLVSLTIG